VAFVIDAYARGIVGWRASRTASFVLDALEQALHDRRPVHRGGLVHRRSPWRSFEAVELATLEWVDWFNNRRLLEPIGNIPPDEAEERYYTVLEQSAMAA
jgi:transposase InsO family protein